MHYSTGTRVLVPMATNTSTGTTAPHTHWLSQLLCLMYMYFTVSMATSTSTNFNCSTHYYMYLPHRQTLPQTDTPISTLSLTIYCMHITCIIRAGTSLNRPSKMRIFSVKWTARNDYSICLYSTFLTSEKGTDNYNLSVPDNGHSTRPRRIMDVQKVASKSGQAECHTPSVSTLLGTQTSRHLHT